MALVLEVTVTPDRLPAAPADVTLRLVLRNTGAQPLAIAPQLAKLAPIASFAGIGITWQLAFSDAAGSEAPITEIRRWYGPPGNPPAPGAAKKYEAKLAPGAEHVTELVACWIPNAHLEPRHLAPGALDPEGMDNIAGPSRFPGLPALADRVVLAKASVLVFQHRWAALAAARAEDDFLRGHVVAFFTSAGDHALRVQYVQSSWMGVGERMVAAAAPAALRI